MSTAALIADDHILDLVWSPDGTQLAVTPTTGRILVVSENGTPAGDLPGDALGNARPAWFQGRLATGTFDGKLHIGGNSATLPGRGIIDRLRTSPDGSLLAVARGRHLHILDSGGGLTGRLPELPAAAADFAWNPTRTDEIAVVGAGGARMWRLDAAEPFARFDWGGASLGVEWSPCGRWLVTADQTPSVHIYDFTRDYPLHIQGYETKVRAFAFSHDGKRLATGGSNVVTVWPCTGPTGPEGVTPIQLDGHDDEVIAAAFSPASGRLATADATGVLQLFSFVSEEKVTRKRTRRPSGIATLAWHPTAPLLAIGHVDGRVAILET